MSLNAAGEALRGSRPTIEQVVHRIRTSVVYEVLRIVADPWNPHLLLMVWLGCHRFEQLVQALRISRSSLTQRLALLQEEGCLWRDGQGSGHADYRLTAKGADLLGIVVLNRQWNERWGLPNRVRPALRLRHACGAALDVRMVCGHCAAEVRARDVKILALPGAPTDLPPPPVYRRARRQAAPQADTPAGALQGEDLAGDRWTALILAVAFMGLRRNSEIEQAIGIAPNVLAARLTLLTENQLFLRLQYQSHPARHEYHLTEKGLDRHAIVLAMMAWGARWADAAPRRPDWLLLHKSCHDWLEPRTVCAACQGAVDADSLRAG